VLIRNLIVATLSIVLVNGCASSKAASPVPDTVKKPSLAAEALNADLTSNVVHAAPVLPRLEKKRHKNTTKESRFDINISSVDIKTFAANISNERDVSIVVHPEVNLKISMQLRNTTLSKALYIVGDIYNLDVRFDDDVYFIFPAGLRTETFNLSYINVNREGASNIRVNTSGLTGSSNGNSESGNSESGDSGNSEQSGDELVNGTTIKTETKINIWADIKEALSTLIGSEEGRTIIVSPQTGTVTVKGFPSDLFAVRDYLHKIEFFLNKQVVLEARILEISLNDDYQQGIEWEHLTSGAKSYGISTTGGIAGNNIAGAIGGITNLSFLTPKFSSVIDLLSTQGDVRTLSSPRITATNNQKAVFKVGEDEYYVTNISTTTVTGNSTTVTPEIELKPFFSGISLDVTPHINERGEVLLHVHPAVIETSEKEKVITLNDEQYILPLAHSSVREVDTIIRSTSGEVVIIGGLMQSLNKDKNSGIPFLQDLPFIGDLFKSLSNSGMKKELIILIKPTIIDSKTKSKSHTKLFNL